MDRGQATRLIILATATRLFTEEGYEGTSIEQVLRASGISRGALYHHFPSKVALFTAVLEATEARVAEKLLMAAKDAANPLDALRAGCFAWLDLVHEPPVRRIVLTDAPSVVGWQAWRELDARYGLGLLKQTLGMVAAAGRMPADMIDLYAHTLLAVLGELALLIARAEDIAATTHNAQQAVEQILSRLAGVEPNAPW